MNHPAPGPAVRAMLADRRRDQPPVLVVDGTAIATRMQVVAGHARAHDIDVLFAVKALPHPAVIAHAATWLAGLDVAGPVEHALCRATPPRQVTLSDPGHTGWHGGSLPTTLTIDCESVADVAAARALAPHAAIALRVSMSSVSPGDDAVGAVAAGDGHRRSRFGVECARPGGMAMLATMIAAAGDAPIGLHVHSAGVVRTSAQAWAALVTALRQLAATLGLQPAFVDVGGGWHGVDDPTLVASFAAMRAAWPGVALRIEPGRMWSHGTVWAGGHVLAARALDDRDLRTTSLSRACHLRWSPVELIGKAPAPGTGRKVQLVGPTCFEDDVLGEWMLGPDALPVGSAIVLGSVSGYALAWNTSFAGVPAADVVVV